jgi:hypothetical protein
MKRFLLKIAVSSMALCFVSRALADQADNDGLYWFRQKAKKANGESSPISIVGRLAETNGELYITFEFTNTSKGKFVTYPWALPSESDSLAVIGIQENGQLVKGEALISDSQRRK